MEEFAYSMKHYFFKKLFYFLGKVISDESNFTLATNISYVKLLLKFQVVDTCSNRKSGRKKKKKRKKSCAILGT